jgi:hypothetical protein
MVISQCDGKRIHRRLARSVAAHERRETALGRSAADPQDQPGFLLAHIRQHRTVDALRAEQIGVEHLHHFFRRERFRRTDHQMPRVLHHHVNPALLAHDGRSGGIGGIL